MLTFSAYKSESQQRTAAEANLLVAANAIDRVLSNAVVARYSAGDLPAASKLASDSTEFYEELLKRSNDPELRFRAAQAYVDIGRIWYLVKQHDKSGQAASSALNLLDSLVTEFPQNGQYREARAYAHGGIAESLFQRDEYEIAIDHCRLQQSDFEQLVDQFPLEPSYQVGHALAISGLGDMYAYGYLRRWEDAEQAYQRAEAIFDKLPATDYAKEPSWITLRAGVLSNWAELCRKRSDFSHATQLLERAISLQKDSLTQWPTNPLARDFLSNHFDVLARTHVDARRHVSAAATVETLIHEFPDRLSSYNRGVNVLISCAELAEKSTSQSNQSGTGVSSPSSPAASETPSPRAEEPERENDAGGNLANKYRQRAHELVALADKAPTRTPDALDGFAWLLLNSSDHSIRDPKRGLEVAQAAAKDAPDKVDTQSALALAYYRNGNWQAAEDATQNAIQLISNPKAIANADVKLLLAMTRWQQGKHDEARQLYQQARHWIENNGVDSEDTRRLADEAKELILKKPC